MKSVSSTARGATVLGSEKSVFTVSPSTKWLVHGLAFTDEPFDQVVKNLVVYVVESLPLADRC